MVSRKAVSRWAILCLCLMLCGQALARQTLWKDQHGLHFWSDEGPSKRKQQQQISMISETPAVYFPAQYDSSRAEQTAVWRALNSQNYDDSWDSIRTFPLMENMNTPLGVYVAKGPLYEPQFQGYVENSLAQWKAALGGRLQYVFVDNPRKAQIQISWVPGYPGLPDQAGETKSSVGSGQITIRTHGIGENLIEANILHELGHALGIMGHSENNNDIMKSGHEWSSYQEFKTYKGRLSANDVAAIQHLYGRNWREGEDLYVAVHGSARIASANGSSKISRLAQRVQSVKRSRK